MSIHAYITNSPQHAATPQEWEALSGDLSNYAANRMIYLNEYGENLPPGVTPTSIKDAIEAGAVWVDWCGWPMYGAGSGAFGDFLLSMGLSLPNFTFFPPMYQYIDAPRLLTVDSPLSYPFIVNDQVYNSVVHVTFSFNATKYVYAGFAIRYGKGAYIWNFGNDNQAFGFDQGTGASEPEYKVASFIQSIISQLPAASGGTVPSSTSSSSSSSCSVSYAMVNGTQVPSIVYSGSTYLEYTAMHALGFYTYNAPSTQCNGSTYYIYSGYRPLLSGTLSGGHWDFKSSGYNTVPSQSQGGSSPVSSSISAVVNGTPVPAIVVNGSTYLLGSTMQSIGFSINSNAPSSGGYYDYTGFTPKPTPVSLSNGTWTFTATVGKPQNGELLLVAGLGLGGLLALGYLMRPPGVKG